MAEAPGARPAAVGRGGPPAPAAFPGRSRLSGSGRCGPGVGEQAGISSRDSPPTHSWARKADAWTRRIKTWEGHRGTLRRSRDRRESRGNGTSALKDPSWVQHDVGHRTQPAEMRTGRARGAGRRSLICTSKGWCQARPSVCPPGDPRPPSVPSAMPLPPRRPPLHGTGAPGTAAPRTCATPTAGGGRGKAWPGPRPAGPSAAGIGPAGPRRKPGGVTSLGTQGGQGR